MRVTVSKAARTVGVARQTINGWVRRGTLKAYTMNGRRYVDLAQVYARADWIGRHSRRVVEELELPR